MTNDNDLAFCDLVCRRTVQITMLSMAGENDRVQDATLALFKQATTRRRELLGLPIPDADIDLAEMRRLYDRAASRARRRIDLANQLLAGRPVMTTAA